MGAHPISAAVSASMWGVRATSPYSSYGQKTGRRASSWRIAKETEHFVCNVNHYSFLGGGRLQPRGICCKLYSASRVSTDKLRLWSNANPMFTGGSDDEAVCIHRPAHAGRQPVQARATRKERASAHGCQCTTALQHLITSPPPAPTRKNCAPPQCRHAEGTPR